MHDYSREAPQWRELRPEHFVLCSAAEAEQWLQMCIRDRSIPSAFLNTVVGSIYIESLYSIPGMGGLLVTCVQRHDNTMVQGIVLLYACVGIIGLILGDVLMVLIDPRINFGKKEGGR